MLEYERQVIDAASGFLAQYGWYILGATLAVLYAYNWAKPLWRKYEDYKYDAELKKNPDLALARMEAIQRAREQMQRKLEEESARAAVLQKEREERKRQETAEKLQRYLAENSDKHGHRLGSGDDYLPLSGGGASTSTYKAPKRKCPGGGCGR